jgi:hypothetical protein
MNLAMLDWLLTFLLYLFIINFFPAFQPALLTRQNVFLQ